MSQNPMISEDRVAEGLWQTITGKDRDRAAAQKMWLVLPESEKQPWLERAKVAIADWLKSQGLSVEGS